MLHRLLVRIIKRPLEGAQDINVVQSNLGSRDRVDEIGRGVVRRGEVDDDARLYVV